MKLPADWIAYLEDLGLRPLRHRPFDWSRDL